MAGYKDKITKDLDRWIAAGLVSPDKRGAILETVPDARRLDAATALAWIGGALFGIAIIAFIAANWDGLPRLARFVLVIAAFLLTAGAGAWASRKQRPILANIALMVSALVFGAAIGLTGQIFDIAADERAACYATAFAAFALALAGRSTGAAVVGVVFTALGDFTGREWFNADSSGAPWMLAAAPLGVYLALRWGSAVLAHASALGVVWCFGWFASRGETDASLLLFLSIVLGAMAAGARWLNTQDKPYAAIFYGWFALGALLFFVPAGYIALFGEDRGGFAGIAHRVVWLALSGGLIALGRFDRHTMITVIGVLSMMGAIVALLNDLGLDLMSAAGIFLLCAIVAMAAGFILRGRKAKVT